MDAESEESTAEDAEVDIDCELENEQLNVEEGEVEKVEIEVEPEQAENQFEELKSDETKAQDQEENQQQETEQSESANEFRFPQIEIVVRQDSDLNNRGETALQLEKDASEIENTETQRMERYDTALSFAPTERLTVPRVNTRESFVSCLDKGSSPSVPSSPRDMDVEEEKAELKLDIQTEIVDDDMDVNQSAGEEIVGSTENSSADEELNANREQSVGEEVQDAEHSEIRAEDVDVEIEKREEEEKIVEQETEAVAESEASVEVEQLQKEEFTDEIQEVDGSRRIETQNQEAEEVHEIQEEEEEQVPTVSEHEDLQEDVKTVNIVVTEVDQATQEETPAQEEAPEQEEDLPTAIDLKQNLQQDIKDLHADLAVLNALSKDVAELQGIENHTGNVELAAEAMKQDLVESLFKVEDAFGKEETNDWGDWSEYPAESVDASVTEEQTAVSKFSHSEYKDVMYELRLALGKFGDYDNVYGGDEHRKKVGATGESGIGKVCYKNMHDEMKSASQKELAISEEVEQIEKENARERGIDKFMRERGELPVEEEKKAPAVQE